MYFRMTSELGNMIVKNPDGFLQCAVCCISLSTTAAAESHISTQQHKLSCQAEEQAKQVLTSNPHVVLMKLRHQLYKCTLCCTFHTTARAMVAHLTCDYHEQAEVLSYQDSYVVDPRRHHYACTPCHKQYTSLSKLFRHHHKIHASSLLDTTFIMPVL